MKNPVKNSLKALMSLALICTAALGTVLYAQEEEDLSLKRLTVIESMHPHELNPHITSYSSDAQLLSGLFEGLFTYDPVNLNPVYAIATDYRISRDKKRWTFTINPNACFDNGEKITAMSVRDSWLKLLSTPGAPYASLLDVISGAQAFRNGLCGEEQVGIYANSEESLSIHLEKPANYLPKLLCHSAFSVVYKESGVYSGPFSLVQTEEQGIYGSRHCRKYRYDICHGRRPLQRKPFPDSRSQLLRRS